MFKWLITLSLFTFAVNCHAVPWYTIYRSAEKLNDSALWQEQVNDLMRQYQLNREDNSYQSEAHDISVGLRKIQNEKVVEIIWNYYLSNAEFKNVALIASFDVALMNTTMQKKILDAFLTSQNSDFKFDFAVRMLDWNEIPVPALSFLFDSLSGLSSQARLRFLSTLHSEMVHRKQPISQFRLIQARTLERLIQTKSSEEAKKLVTILAQLERWTGDSYAKLAALLQQNLIANDCIISIVKELSHEVNGVIGATFENLTPASVDSFFNVLITAKDNPSSQVQAAVIEASLWQVSKEQFPQELRNWIPIAINSDSAIKSATIDFYLKFSKQTKAYFSKELPGAFPNPDVGPLGNVLNKCTNALLGIRSLLKPR